MSYQAAQVSIESEFVTNWTYTQVARDNVDFEPQSLTEWVRITVLPASGRQASMGADPLFRYNGLFCVQIFTRSGLGWGRATELADLITPLFRNRRLGNIQFYVPEMMRVGVTDGWYQVNVDCPFYREEF